MNIWNALLSVGGSALVASLGYVLRGHFLHELRIVRLETRTDGELAHIAHDISEIKIDIKELREKIG